MLDAGWGACACVQSNKQMYVDPASTSSWIKKEVNTNLLSYSMMLKDVEDVQDVAEQITRL